MRSWRGWRLVAAAIGVIVVLGGAGTAWAMTHGSGPVYRLASAHRADVSQAVDADGSLSADDQASAAFAVSGTVSRVAVTTGDSVTAGQTLARLDPTNLQSAVSEAMTKVSQAEQRLSDDEEAQDAGASSSGSGTLSADSAGATPLTGSDKSAPTGASGSASSLQRAQPKVADAATGLYRAVQKVNADVQQAGTACTVSSDADPTTAQVIADSGGVVSGTADSAAVWVTLLDSTTTSGNPQQPAADGSYAFNGLTAGATYTVVLVPRLDTSGCATALATLDTDQSGSGNTDSVTSTNAALQQAMDALDKLVATLGSGTGGANTGAGTRTGSGSTASGTRPGSRTDGGNGTGRSGGASASPSRSPSAGGTRPAGGTGGQSGGAGTRTTVVITAAQIAADAKQVAAMKAELAVAKGQLGAATLTAPISGTVADVALAEGQSVAAHSSSATIKIVGPGALTIDLNIPLTSIDLIKVGQQARITVDGMAKAVAGRVSYVGALNSASASGTSATYPVIVQLDETSTKLLDGMGASVAIDVGTIHDAVVVPLSAVHTTGTRHFVRVYSGGKVTAKQVTLGVRGADEVQVFSGLGVGQRVVIAEVSAAIPSSNSTSRFGRRASLTGLTGGARFPGTGGFAGQPGGR
jgi:RND family efflux transporter MFP subunit